MSFQLILYIALPLVYAALILLLLRRPGGFKALLYVLAAAVVLDFLPLIIVAHLIGVGVMLWLPAVPLLVGLPAVLAAAVNRLPDDKDITPQERARVLMQMIVGGLIFSALLCGGLLYFIVLHTSGAPVGNENII